MNLEIETEALRKLLHDGIVNFEYEKKDGTKRQAKGTLQETHIPTEQLPKNESEDDGRANGTNLKYWDLDKDAWRALSTTTEVVTLLN